MDTASLTRDPLFVASVAALGYQPVSPREWQEWRNRINEFRQMRSTPPQIAQAIREYARRWPERTITLRAVQTYWAILTGGAQHGTGVEISRNAGATDSAERLKRQREARDAEERQQPEIDQLVEEIVRDARARHAAHGGPRDLSGLRGPGETLPDSGLSPL
jgi:hypothetical protein